MPGTLEQLLGIRHLSDMARSFFDEPSQTIFVDLFKKGRQILPEGDTAEWDEVQAHRHLAPFHGHKSPFTNVQEMDVVNRRLALAHVKVYKDLDGHRMYNQRMYGQLTADARAYLLQELEDLTMLVKRTAEYACGRVVHGNLNVTAATVPGSTSVFQYQPGIQALANVAAWDLANTSIVASEIPIMLATYVQNSGVPAAQVIYNDVTERDIKANDEVIQYIREGGLFSAEMLRSGHVDSEVFDKMRLGGLTWHKHVGGYVPEGGAFTRYTDDDTVLVLPADSELRDTLGMAEGYGLVPSGPFAQGAEGGQALVQRAPGRGVYSYAVVKTNPPGVRLFVGYPFLPVVLVPARVMDFSTT
jgi:hypothetical protein